jgi:hypothetical protein
MLIIQERIFLLEAVEPRLSETKKPEVRNQGPEIFWHAPLKLFHINLYKNLIIAICFILFHAVLLFYFFAVLVEFERRLHTLFLH